MLLRSFSRRDAILVLLGASTMHIWSILFRSVDFTTISKDHDELGINRSEVDEVNQPQFHVTTTTTTAFATKTITKELSPTPDTDGWSYRELDAVLSSSGSGASSSSDDSSDDPFPPSRLIAHAPGWTIIRNLYMSNGTLYVLLPEGVHPTTPALSPEYLGPALTKYAHTDLTYGYTTAPEWPQIRMMTSTGKSGTATPESEVEREPTKSDMQFIGIKEGRQRWGGKAARGDAVEGDDERVWVVKGNTLLFNDPPQFLRHYYHFVAELWLGVQAFWSSAFSKTDPTDLKYHFSTHWEAGQVPYRSSGATATKAQARTTLPPIHRAIFMHSNADGWRDDPGFNSYFLRGVFPSLTVEHVEDWTDRIKASSAALSSSGERVWRFPLVLLVDRTASFKGEVCGRWTQRTAAEAWDYMRRRGKLRGIAVGGWWAPVREAMWRFAGVPSWGKNGGFIDGSEVVKRLDGNLKEQLGKVVEHTKKIGESGELVLKPENMDDVETRRKVLDVRDDLQALLPMPEEVVITYISRQSSRHRKLVKADHEGLVVALKELVKRKTKEREDALAKHNANAHGKGSSSTTKVPPKWELDILEAEHLTKDAQVHAAARTTFMLGIHGNGLTHLIWMKPTRISTVIEMFCPGGFAHDYQWTSRSLGVRHWAMWNDTMKGGALSGEGKPDVNYPECFQGDEIPVYGPEVARLIEERVKNGLKG